MAAWMTVCVLTVSIGCSQKTGEDTGSQVTREDLYNIYQSEQISTLDILEALDFAGIHIYKFHIGKFDKKYGFHFVLDEYAGGRLIKTEELVSANAPDQVHTNEYTHKRSDGKIHHEYIDRVKIITKDEANGTRILIDTVKEKINKKILFQTEDKQRFLWRRYIDTTWKLDEKIPLLVCASTWPDEITGLPRFSGPPRLSENDQETRDLLLLSPHYFVLSYVVTELTKVTK